MSGCTQANVRFHSKSQSVTECTGVINKVDSEFEGTTYDRKCKIIWYRIIVLGALHLGAIYATYLVYTSAKIFTLIFAFILALTSGLGITAGAHRLWTHRAYKAKLALRILLVVLNTMAYQFSVIDWSRDHRVHHKYSDTDADPHNAKRGFFYAHIGWLLFQKHPENIAKCNEIDMSDLENDPVLRFQHNFYYILMPIAFCIAPTLIPFAAWNETLWNAWFIAVALRYTIVANITFSVNSFAHLYGNQPYDRFINPVENKIVGILALGEGWHNYHHTFPWDYKTSELGKYSTNFTALFIDTMAKIGWAYDLKTVTLEMIEQRVKRTGDGTHRTFNRHDKSGIDLEKNQLLNTVINNTVD